MNFDGDDPEYSDPIPESTGEEVFIGPVHHSCTPPIMDAQTQTRSE